jgi:hypothetical protein
MRFRVPVADLTPVMVSRTSPAPGKPAKRSVNVEEVHERLTNVQHSSMEQLDGDIAILNKYLKSVGVPAEAIDELDRLRTAHKADWDAAIEAIMERLE